ncbi:bestrophin-like domain [Actinomadura parmotrematis]|uniref:DUF4239 domain-containing protein n=1 Tax=Actinomadura parmotrematis TaxID=2864039 RepID=A0ABS7FVZ6_9ACTN|nr:DUF4239 domain-containing protein [Actinomadura parmotrematis]MBW8483747.1 DUF4239 domain-containing protein [Actinomadura parmotrematis]
MLVQTILAAVAAVAMVALVAIAFRKYGRTDDEPDGAANAHAGAMLSALFLLVFAIALIVPWTAADDERRNTGAEAQALVELYWDTASLPAAARAGVRADVRGYLDFVVDREFPALSGGSEELDQQGWRRLDALRTRLGGLTLSGDRANDARDDALERLREAYAARRQRAVAAGPILPHGVLAFTAITGVIMIFFPFLAGARPRGMALVTLGLTAALLGVAIYICFALNHAFTGPLAVKPDAFAAALKELARIP